MVLTQYPAVRRFALLATVGVAAAVFASGCSNAPSATASEESQRVHAGRRNSRVESAKARAKSAPAAAGRARPSGPRRR